MEEAGLEAAPLLHSEDRHLRELWRDYAAAFADDRSKELYTNIIVFDTMRKKPMQSPQCPPQKRVDGRRRKEAEAEETVAVGGGGDRGMSTPVIGTPPPFFRVIQLFLREGLPMGYRVDGVLCTENWAGIGFLRPEIAPPAGETTTLELHRRVISLERAGVGLLQLLFAAFVSRGARRFLSPDDIVDAEVAFEFRGGVSGGGERYWIDGALPPPCDFADRVDTHGKEGLYRTLCYLHANRQSALRRRYIVADDGAWGLPVFARLHTLSRAGPLDPTGVSRAVEELVHERHCAVLADRVRLVRYGVHMTHYCLRLQVILRQLDARVPSTVGVARFAGDPDGRVLPVYLEQTCDVGDDVADLIVEERLRVERGEIGATLGVLGIPYHDALVFVHVVTQGIQRAMETDAHTRNKTCFLHGSPSLPSAQCATYMYTTGACV